MMKDTEQPSNRIATPKIVLLIAYMYILAFISFSFYGFIFTHFLMFDLYLFFALEISAFPSFILECEAHVTVFMFLWACFAQIETDLHMTVALMLH